MTLNAINAFPRSFPTQNSHRVVLYQQPLPSSDFERLEDKVADAIALSREVCEMLRELPRSISKPFQSDLDALKNKVECRHILNDLFRVSADEILRHLDNSDADDRETEERISRICCNLRVARDASFRVTDLLAAERDVGWQRSIGKE